MSRNPLLIAILYAGLGCMPAPVHAEGTKPKTPAVINVPPPPEEPPIYYATPPPPPPPAPPAGYVPLEPRDPGKPQSDPSAAIQTPPDFPEDEMCRGIGGTTELLLGYDKVGQVLSVEVRRSSGNRNLDRAAIETARTWRITPGLRNGFPVAGLVVVPVEFVADRKVGWRCETAVRIENLRMGRKLVLGGEDHIEPTRSLVKADVALLQVSYVALEGKPLEPIEVDWYRDGGTNDPIYHHAPALIAAGADTAEFRLAFNAGWRPGNYTVVVLVNGQPRRELHFTVAGDSMFLGAPAANE